MFQARFQTLYQSSLQLPDPCFSFQIRKECRKPHITPCMSICSRAFELLCKRFVVLFKVCMINLFTGSSVQRSCSQSLSPLSSYTLYGPGGETMFSGFFQGISMHLLPHPGTLVQNQGQYPCKSSMHEQVFRRHMQYHQWYSRSDP